MIYEDVDEADIIRQGDLFFDVPKISISLDQMPVIDGEQVRPASWKNLVLEGTSHNVAAIFGITSVNAVVITQDCDATRGHTIHLAATTTFLDATGTNSPPRNAKKWQSLIMSMQRTNPRIFYLPQSDTHQVAEPLAVDFREIFTIPRTDLLDLRSHRKGRINRVARDHFRESIGKFFGRYAYNEWYSLTAEQFATYAEGHSEEITPFPWQDDSDSVSGSGQMEACEEDGKPQ